MRGLGYVNYQATPHTPKLRHFPLIHSVHRIISLWPAIQQLNALRTSFFAGFRIWKRSKKSRPKRWLNYRTVLIIYSKRTITCRLVWKRIGVKMHQGAAILHLRLNRIEARSPSCQATVMLQQTMSYPLVALRYLIFQPQRITWRLNQQRGPCTVPTVLSVAWIAEYEEKSVESDDNQSRPPKMCPRSTGV